MSEIAPPTGRAEDSAGGARVRAWLAARWPWLARLIDPRMPGMDERSPRAHPLALFLMLAFVAGQVVLRYQAKFLFEQKWLWLHVLIGFAGCFLIMLLFHGPALFRRVRPRTWAILGFGLLALCGFWYLGREDAYRKWFMGAVPPRGELGRLFPFMYFSLGAFFFRTVVPFSFARLALRAPPWHLGLFAPKNPHAPAVRHIWPLYLALYLGVLPFVIGVSDTPGFMAKYPMARPIIGAEGEIAAHHFIVYEAFYLLIFISGEGFWRGFLAFGTERDFGLYGLALMVVPYVTTHFGKPMPETLGAIAAGMTLGWLALKHRSVWLGVALHYAVAVTMDLMSIVANQFWISW